jgi:hypothetical protein
MRLRRIVGLDLSKNHYAASIVDLDWDNEFTVRFSKPVFRNSLTKITFGWGVKSKVDKWKKMFKAMNIHYVPEMHDFKDKQTRNIELANYICRYLLNDIGLGRALRFEGVIFAIEDYANKSTIQLEVVEFTSIIKHYIYKNKGAIRLYDPKSVKKWMGNGNFDKEQMLEAVNQEIMHIPEELNDIKNDTPAYDIADSLALLNMLQTELIVRYDPRELMNLSNNRKDIFNRVTSGNPDNLLVRPFLCKKDIGI